MLHYRVEDVMQSVVGVLGILGNLIAIAVYLSGKISLMETAHKIGNEFDSCNSYPVFETAAYLMVSVIRLGDF